jgi:phage portal protein BeeE
VSYLANSGGSVYGSMEWLSRMYLDACLSHWIAVWKSEIEFKIGEKPSFDTDFIVKPSLAETFAALRTGVESGVISRNEARELLDYPLEDGLDEFVVALNMGQQGGSTNIGTNTKDLN